MLADLRAKRRARDKELRQRLRAQQEANSTDTAIKTEEQPCELTLLEKKVIRQVEFYFGDYNLPKDRFMLKVFEENGGWMPMDTLMTFKRLKSLTSDQDFVMSALQKSPTRLITVTTPPPLSAYTQEGNFLQLFVGV